jgi:hypothetical protein
MYADNKQKTSASMLDVALDLISRKINPVPVEYPGEKSRGKRPSTGAIGRTLLLPPRQHHDISATEKQTSAG